MKKIILLPILLLLFCSQTQAQFNSSNLVFNGQVRAIVKAPDGSTYVGGAFTTVNGITRNRLAKINADGSLNNSFNLDVNETIRALALDPSGNLYIGGYFTMVGGEYINNLAKINVNGTIDTSFNPNMDFYVLALAIDLSGNLYAGGKFTSVGGPLSGVTRNYLAKFNADGSLNSSFSPDFDDWVVTLALDQSGNLYAGGYFHSVDGLTRNGLAKINTNGTLNSSFNPNINSYVVALAVDPLGNLYTGGWFNSVGGVFRNRLAKFNADGSLNSNFTPNIDGGSTPYIYALSLDSLGNLYAGGGYTTVDGIPRSGLAKINADGSLNNSFNPSLNDYIAVLTMDSSDNLYAGGAFTNYYAGYSSVSLGNTVFNNDKDSAATYYPNPTTGILNINYSKEISSLSVVNLLGQTVLTQTTSGMAAQLDLSALTDGTYIVKMVSEGKTQTFKVMKGL